MVSQIYTRNINKPNKIGKQIKNSTTRKNVFFFSPNLVMQFNKYSDKTFLNYMKRNFNVAVTQIPH